MPAVVGGMNRVWGIAGTTRDAATAAPLCTITIVEAGSLNPVTLYADTSGLTPLANPFLAALDGYWDAYCTAQRVDVIISGVGIVAPYTFGDVATLPQTPVTVYANLPVVSPTDIGALAFVSDTFFDHAVGLYEQYAADWARVGGVILDGEAYGMVGDANSTGTTGIDNTPAFNALIADAAQHLGGSIACRIGPGNFRFLSAPAAIPTGVTLLGNGSVGSTASYGTRFYADYAEVTALNGFLTWDGSLAAGNAGTGGGPRDLQLYKSSAQSGGTALKFTGANDSHRSGFNHVANVLIATAGASTWNKGIAVDGTGLYTAGTKGVRTLYLSGVDIASCLDTDSNLWLFNAVHVHAVQMHLFPGTSAACGITVNGNASGPSENIFFSSCNVDGNFTCDHANAVVYHGRIGGNLSWTSNTNDLVVIGVLGGSPIGSGSISVNLYLDRTLAVNVLQPLLDGTNSYLYSGIDVLPLTANAGADLLRAKALPGATGVPLGLHCTPVAGGAGSPYWAYNQNQNIGDNNAVYFRTGYPAFRSGNPLGNGTYPLNEYVAPAGVQGAAITYLASRKVDGTTGINEFPLGIQAGVLQASGTPRAFTLLSVDSVIDPGLIANGAFSAVVNVTVTGAALNDQVLASFSSIIIGAWVISAYVSGANNVKVYLGNFTGGGVDLVSGTLRTTVIHWLN